MPLSRAAIQSRENGDGMIVTCPLCATRFLIDPRALGAAGRSVRCTQCNHVWMQLPAEDAPRRVDLPLPGLDRPRAASPASGPSRSVAAAPARPLPPPPTLPPPPAFAAVAETAVLAEDEKPLPAPPSLPPRRPEPAYAAAPSVNEDDAVVRGSNRPLVIVAVVAAVLALLWYGRDFLMDRVPALEGAYAAVGLGPGDPRNDLEVRGLTSNRKEVDGRPLLVIDGEVANVSNVTRRVPPLRITLEDSARHAIKSWVVVVTDGRLPPGGAAPFHTSVTDPGVKTVGASVSFDDGTN